MLAHSVVNDRLERICAAAGVTRITPHGLRHTGATWLARLNVPPSTISQRLGHTSVAFTLDNYVHSGRAEQQDASARLDALVAQSGQDVTSDVTYTNRSLPVSPSRAAK
jgi:integrase